VEKKALPANLAFITILQPES